MRLFRRATPPPDDDSAREVVGELLDSYHHRASIVTGDDEMIIELGKVLENITLTMERWTTTSRPRWGSRTPPPSRSSPASSRWGWMAPGATRGNTAMQIMTARYPEELVSLPVHPGGRSRSQERLQNSDILGATTVRCPAGRSA
jgi:hypothetical protein